MIARVRVQGPGRCCTVSSANQFASASSMSQLRGTQTSAPWTHRQSYFHLQSERKTRSRPHAIQQTKAWGALLSLPHWTITKLHQSEECYRRRCQTGIHVYFLRRTMLCNVCAIANAMSVPMMPKRVMLGTSTYDEAQPVTTLDVRG